MISFVIHAVSGTKMKQFIVHYCMHALFLYIYYHSFIHVFIFRVCEKKNCGDLQHIISCIQNKNLLVDINIKTHVRYNTKC